QGGNRLSSVCGWAPNSFAGEAHGAKSQASDAKIASNEFASPAGKRILFAFCWFFTHFLFLHIPPRARLRDQRLGSAEALIACGAAMATTASHCRLDALGVLKGRRF